MAKIQRPETLPYLPKLIPLLKKHHVRTLIAESSTSQSPEGFSEWVRGLSKFFKIFKEPYLPTKTIIIDLDKSEKQLFDSFSSAKRRAVRRAQNNGVNVIESNNIKKMIKIKNKSAGIFGEITTYGMDKLWKIFSPKHATILLAYQQCNNVTTCLPARQVKQCSPIGGILLLFWDKTAYYWLVGAIKKGKQLFAPTILVWEALKLSKKRGMKRFDFIGVWDERTPRQNTEWKGFSKFKEGFGGNTLSYPINK